MEFEEMIYWRNNVLNLCEKAFKAHDEEDKNRDPRIGKCINDSELLFFEPLFKPEDKIIQVKIFYGTRKEGVERGYTKRKNP